MIAITSLVLQTSALADVAHQCLDSTCRPVASPVDVRRDLNPEGAVIGAPEPKQKISYGAVARKLFDERAPRPRINEALGIERPHLIRIGLWHIAEH